MTPTPEFNSLEWHEAQVKALEQQYVKVRQEAEAARDRASEMLGALNLAMAYRDAVRKAEAPEEATDGGNDGQH